jgi:hypothetical protein
MGLSTFKAWIYMKTNEWIANLLINELEENIKKGVGG